jgi:class 3 adenylate cyclase
MGLKEDLEGETKSIFATVWKTRDGRVVPEPEDVKLGNDAVTFDEAVVLYADLAESTQLVNTHTSGFAAEVYKSYLHCASKIIRSEGGIITAFDGDRVMAVFTGDSKRTDSARCALKINYAVQMIINPAIKRQYPDSTFVLRQAVGIDVSKLFVARTGIRGSNDLVWVGRAANYAAKLCSLRVGSYASFITADVYSRLQESAKIGSDGRNMWEEQYWSDRSITIYRSSWRWGV